MPLEAKHISALTFSAPRLVVCGVATSKEVVMFQKVSPVGELVCKFSCVLQIEHYFLLDIIPLSSGHCGQNHNSMSNMATSFWIPYSLPDW